MLDSDDKQYIQGAIESSEHRLFSVIEDFRQDVDKRFQVIDKRFQEMNERFEEMNDKFAQIIPMREENRILILELTGVKSRTHKLEKRVDRLERKTT